MFTKPIEFFDARISALNHKFKDGTLNSRILVNATVSAAIAKHLECDSLLFLANGAPKEGFDKLELSTGCAAFRARFEAPVKMKQQFEITGDSADSFVVERKAEGVMQLKMRLNYHGDPYEALAYVLAIGAGESVLKLTPLQAELEATEEVTDAKVTVTTNDGKTHSVPISKETLRAAVGAQKKSKHRSAGR